MKKSQLRQIIREEIENMDTNLQPLLKKYGEILLNRFKGLADGFVVIYDNEDPHTTTKDEELERLFNYIQETNSPLKYNNPIGEVRFYIDGIQLRAHMNKVDKSTKQIHFDSTDI